jgi:Fe-S oxidoreductase
MNAEQQLFGKLGCDAQILDAGCCGMAGSFGFERDKYELSQRIGELALLPAVRAASDGTCIVADGFSCREQIAQGTQRRAASGRASGHGTSVNGMLTLREENLRRYRRCARVRSLSATLDSAVG